MPQIIWSIHIYLLGLVLISIYVLCSILLDWVMVACIVSLGIADIFLHNYAILCGVFITLTNGLTDEIKVLIAKPCTNLGWFKQWPTPYIISMKLWV